MTAWSFEVAVSSGKKQRLSVYLEPDLKHRLADFADRREQSASLIAEAAIASFLSPDADERKEAAIVKRLDRLERSLLRIERDLEITNETLVLFIRSWLNSIVPLPENAQVVARVKGAERYEKFIEALGHRLAMGTRIRQELASDFTSND
ncbi:CopG family transcriptional regulator [Sinorhizobium meliloti]|uniref:CopG family transcriptional regulator n=1 Tax=Rhizobium meliloti TaxID=382 RepID=UPI000B49DF12|nr:CopG family transcriptional regulator [Sinorhizobium meliloti]ASP73319.1 CopG family transcriptional regulator [Sinorhizobium meliloti]MDE3854436.1 CopG family transcriptional regulator [Sinorhizobium meliloti]MQW52849.1 CopG family transcriptional regulator [Sinorhizobium meliloti]